MVRSGWRGKPETVTTGQIGHNGTFPSGIVVFIIIIEIQISKFHPRTRKEVKMEP